MSRLYKCAVHSCLDITSPRHCFPNPDKQPDKFKIWLNSTGNVSLQMVPHKTIYSSHRICQLHFSKEFVTRNNRLAPSAKPTLYLPTDTEGSSNLDECRVSTNNDLPDQVNKSADDENYASASVVCQPSTSSVLVSQIHETPKRKADMGSLEMYGCVSTRKRTRYIKIAKNSTPRKRRLYQEMRIIRKRLALCNSRNLSLKKRLILAEKSSKYEFLANCGLTPISTIFFKCQLRNLNKKPKGRRFTMEDKIMALSLIKQSGKSYRLLSKLFTLPSRKALTALLKNIPIHPGINNLLFNHIKQNVQKLKSKDKLCTLIFDEMALQPNLHWNPNTDIVEGFEDSGFERKRKVADHVQVFMIRGIFRKWKQPIFYSYCEGTTNTTVLVRTLKEVVRSVHSTGLKILATICDQGSTNVAAINSLIDTTKGEYLRQGKTLTDRVFEVDGHAIIPLYDPPHLLKGIRNNFLTKHISFVNSKNQRCSAKWQHIVEAYKIDSPGGRLRIMKKLTDSHVIPSRIKKMKVSYCSQVFSNQVASGISFMCKNKVTSADGIKYVDPDGVHTAELLLFFNDLFDSINGGSVYPLSGVRLRCAVSRSSPHIKFWNRALQKLEQMYFVNVEGGQKSVPPSLQNWIITLQGFKKIYEVIQDLGYKYFLPRMFNQDPVENYFGQMRQHGGRNINPSCSHFGQYFKSLLINNFVSSHSVGANCEIDDSSDLLLSFKNLLSLQKEVEDSNVDTVIFTPNFDVNRDLDAASLGFVSGYIIKNVLNKFKNCEDCKQNLISDPTDAAAHVLIKEREYHTTTRLLYCREDIFNTFKHIYNITVNILPEVASQKALYQRILKTVMANIQFNYNSNCNIHNIEKVRNFMIGNLIRLLIHNYFNGLNKVLMGRDSRIPNEDFYQYCHKKFLKSRSRQYNR